jgi:deoxyribonuclease-4
MGREAVRIGANTFQFFTRNPRGGSAKEINEKDVAAFLSLAKENDISSIVAHAPYTLNACAADAGIRRFAFDTMADDLRRMEYIPGNFYNFHPGSHVQQGVETGISLIAEMLNRVLKPEQSTVVLLETMAGKGSEVGRTFDELRAIIDRVELNSLLGVCLDTCHIFDGGYDIIHHLDEVVSEFDKVIGLERLRAIHLNDSLNLLDSHKDRHAKIGEGHIGLDAITRIINHPALRCLPFNLETPNEIDGYAAEIKLLKTLYKD